VKGVGEALPSAREGAGVVQLPGNSFLWVDTTAPASGRRFYRAVAGPTNKVWIPSGTFTMGSPPQEAERWDVEGPQTVVTLTGGFFMSRYEVTQGEFVAVTGYNPSSFRNGTDGTNSSGSGNAITDDWRHPVESVSWIEAVNYCARLTALERSAGRLPPGWLYRLPTEAEWEYACRDGTTGAFHYGPALRSGMANFHGVHEYDSSLGTTNNPGGLFLGRTTVVGSYEANGWGLYDMHGNVREWCTDVADGSGLPGGRVTDPFGPPLGMPRLVRGGSWSDVGGQCRSAVRNYSASPGDRYNDCGFRVVLASGDFCLSSSGGCPDGYTFNMTSGGRVCTSNPHPVNTCNFGVGCNNNLDCEVSCAPWEVCIPPDYSGGGSYGHCDNSR
jgi:formylglycine-generating enzyme required for sulfatase activity